MSREGSTCIPKRQALVGLLLATLFLLVAVAVIAQGVPSAGTPAPGNVLNSLTEEERTWLRDHPVITVAHDPDWAPVEFSDERGEMTGMSGDYVRLVEQRLGVGFKRIPNLSWQEVYDRQKRWEIDMAACVAETPVRTFWAFTKPYLRIPIVIATQSDVAYIGDMKELFGKKVALVRGYAIDDWVTRDFPEINLARVNTVPEGLAALQRGDVFAYLDNLLIIGDYQAKLKVANIKIAGQTPYVNAQRMAVRKDWAPLAGILDKALDSISETERQEIYRKWLPIRYEHGFDYALFWKLLAGFAVILLGLALWIRKLAKEIRARQRAEAALRESEETFRKLYEDSPDPILLMQGNRFIRCNSATLRFLGVADERRFLGSDPTGISPERQPDGRLSAEAAPEYIAKAHSEGFCRFEWLCKTYADVPFLLEVTLMPIRLRGEQLLHITWRDITGRKRAEEALQESEAFRKRVFDSSPVAMVVMDATTFQYLDCNLAAVEIYRLSSREETLGKNPLAVSAPVQYDGTPSSEKVPLFIGQALAEGSVVFEWRHQRPGGEVWDAEVHLLGFQSGQRRLLQFTLQDITERKRAEEALRESEERFASFMRHLPGFAFVKDHHRRVLYVNELFETGFGIPLAEWRGKTNDEIWPGEVSEKIRRDDEAVLAAGAPLAIIEEVPTRGERRTYRTIKFPIPRPEGPSWLGGMSVDITELKQSEAALRSSLEEKESLLKEVHHRVKNNLQVISSLFNLQARKVQNPEVLGFLRDTQNRIRSMALLHETLYRSGNLARVELLQYVKNVCTHVASTYASGAGKIRLLHEITDVTVDLDRAIPAGLIISELVSNAFKHAFPSRSNGEILVELQRAPEHQLVLRVSDNGIGLPAGTDPQSTESLGLLLVRSLTRQLDGRMSVSRGQGTVFEIIFPGQSV
jgi:PAS domain S-box-containing protein